MTEAHKMLLESLAGDKTYTICELAELDGEIDDPFGGDDEEYEKTADRLYIALAQIENKLFEVLLEENRDDDK